MLLPTDYTECDEPKVGADDRRCPDVVGVDAVWAGVEKKAGLLLTRHAVAPTDVSAALDAHGATIPEVWPPDIEPRNTT